MTVKSCAAGKLALLAIWLSSTASAQTISTRPLDAVTPPLAAVPVDNPLALAALFLLLVVAGWWSLRRSHIAQRVVSLVLVGALAGLAGHSSGLMAQVINAFTNSSGETLSIGVVPITAGGFTGFQPADFSNATGIALQIEAIDPPNLAECFATQPANTLLSPGVPIPSPHPACTVGATLASSAICRIDVEAICRALAPEPGATLTAVSPNSGSTMGATLVTVTGTGLSSATSISFGGIAATISAITATSITAMTPPHPAGTVDVEVTTAGGTTQAPSSYTYMAAPTVTQISPSMGTAAGGTSVTLTGTGLSSATAVTFDGIPVPFSVINSTTIAAITPAHAAGIVDVAITTQGGVGQALQSYTFVLAPSVAQVAPASGTMMGGTLVTVIGTGLASATGITFGGMAASIVGNTQTTVSAITPAHPAGTVDVVVTTPGGTVQAPSSYTFLAASTLTQIAPSSGTISGGTAVTLTGTGLAAATGITFGGAAATSVMAINSTTVTAVTPAHAAGIVDVAVTTPNGVVQALQSYTFALPPTVAQISPPSGSIAGGTSVTVTGIGLASATAITFGGTAATVVVNTPTSITAISPAHPAGTVDITVTTPGGIAEAPSSYTFVALPTIAQVFPSIGTISGGQLVTLMGTGLSSATAVTFDGIPVPFSVMNSTTINALTVPHAAGVVNVAVTTPGGTGSLIQGYTYLAP